MDYADGSRRLERFFRRKGMSPDLASDLAQDTWVRLLVAVERGSVRTIEVGALYTTAWFVLRNHWKKPQLEQCYGDFAAEARIIQLYPEGGGEGCCRNHPDREAVEGKTQCQECLDALKAASAARKASGKCRSHPSRDVVPGRTRCQECIDRERARAARRRAA